MPISLETIYKEIARELFAEFPDAHWGPGHVCLEDGNWGAYQQAIDFLQPGARLPWAVSVGTQHVSHIRA